MQYQLRSYKIKAGTMDEFIDGWRTYIVPLRRKMGFVVVGAWNNAETSEFVWMVGHDHPCGFAAADAEYYAHPDRANVGWDPLPFLEQVALKILDPVGADLLPRG